MIKAEEARALSEEAFKKINIEDSLKEISKLIEDAANIGYCHVNIDLCNQIGPSKLSLFHLRGAVTRALVELGYTIGCGGGYSVIRVAWGV